MGVASYEVVPKKDASSNEAWAIKQEGKVEGSYATKEAAFEAIAGAASNAIKKGDEITIRIPGSRGREPTLGKS
jgi:hypothetical protein